MLYDFHAFSNIHITVNMWAWTHPVPTTELQQIYRATPVLTLTQYTYMDLTDITSITHITVFILFLTFDLQYFSYNLYRGYLIIYVICCNYCFILLILYAEMYARI